MKEEVYYFDKDGNAVEDETQASKVIIREINEKGEIVRETFGNINKQNEPYEITQEEYDMLISEGYEVNDSEFKVVI